MRRVVVLTALMVLIKQTAGVKPGWCSFDQAEAVFTIHGQTTEVDDNKNFRVVLSALDVGVGAFISGSRSQLLPYFEEACRGGDQQQLQSDCVSDLDAQLTKWVKGTCSPLSAAPDYRPGSEIKNCDQPLREETLDPIEHGDLVSLNASAWRRVLSDLIIPGRGLAAWNEYYDDVVLFLQGENQGAWQDAQLRVIEVGTAFGGLGDRVLGELRGANFYAVDPFEAVTSNACEPVHVAVAKL